MEENRKGIRIDKKGKISFMIKKIFVGIDNGTSGTITIISGKTIDHFPTPITTALSYTKTKQKISRINHQELERRLPKGNVYCLLERPMINPLRWKASMSAIRALEATLIILERLNIPYEYIDSKEWQKYFLPKSPPLKKGEKKTKQQKDAEKRALKTDAIDIAKRLFPMIKTKDADSILIAEYARRKRL